MRLVILSILLTSCATAEPKRPAVVAKPEVKRTAALKSAFPVPPKPSEYIPESEALRAQLALAEMNEAKAKMQAAALTLQIKDFLWEQVKKSLLDKFGVNVDRGDDWAPQPDGKWKITRKDK